MILRYPVGNASAAKMDENALGPWVSVARKGGRSKKVPFKKSDVFLGQVPENASVTVAKASSVKPVHSSLRPGCRETVFEKECREDPKFLQQVSSLERMLRVKKQHDAAVGAAASADASAGGDGIRTVAGMAAYGPSGTLRGVSSAGAGSSDGVLTSDARVASSAGAGEVCRGAGGVVVAAARVALSAGAGGVCRGAGGDVAEARVASCAGSEGSEGVLTPEARVAATAGESAGIISLHQDLESARSSLCHTSSLARADGDEFGDVGVASAAVFAASGVAALPVRRFTTYALAAANACGEVARGNNSCLYTAPNSLRVQNSRRKVSLSSSVGSRSVVQTVDMSPALAAGTYRRSADEVHDQRQISRKRQAVCSVGDPDPGPGPGPGGRSGSVGGSLGCAAAIRGIPCSLVMPPGRHQRAPQSLGWEWVCGSEKSGVWVLKGATRTYNLPRNLDDVGIVWERRSGYETAWATPGHVCSCSYGYGHGPVLPQSNPSVFTEVIKLWSRVASLLTPWCAKGEVPTGVNLNRYAGDGSFIPWHRDNERLFGSPSEPKVIVSMSLGHSVLFKLCRRASEKTVTPIWLDHGDLLVMDGLTQEEFWHSTASELEGPRVNLTYRWISQHIRSCPQAGLICGALPPVAPDLAEPNSCGGRSRKSK